MILQDKANQTFNLMGEYKNDIDINTILYLLRELTEFLLSCGITASEIKNRIEHPKWFDTTRLKNFIRSKLVGICKNTKATDRIVSVIKTVATASSNTELVEMFVESKNLKYE